MTALDATAPVQDTADPADGLTEDERTVLFAALAKSLDEHGAWTTAGHDLLPAAVECILRDRAARQRPTDPPEDQVTAAVKALVEKYRGNRTAAYSGTDNFVPIWELDDLLATRAES